MFLSEPMTLPALEDFMMGHADDRTGAHDDRRERFGIWQRHDELQRRRPVNGEPAAVGNGVHIAFAAENRAMVDSFHATALELGGASDGEPGLRPHYDANYCGAYVRDPDGNKLDAVTFSAKCVLRDTASARSLGTWARTSRCRLAAEHPAAGWA